MLAWCKIIGIIQELLFCLWLRKFVMCIINSLAVCENEKRVYFNDYNPTYLKLWLSPTTRFHSTQTLWKLLLSQSFPSYQIFQWQSFIFEGIKVLAPSYDVMGGGWGVVVINACSNFINTERFLGFFCVTEFVWNVVTHLWEQKLNLT